MCESILGPLPDPERASLQAAILSGLAAASASKRWADDGGKFICDADTFLDKKKWLDSWTPLETDEDEAFIQAQYAAASEECD